MIRPTLILASVLFCSGLATAENSISSTGRYQVTPDEDGFARLDTATGALAHCGKQEGIWRCAVLAEARFDIDRDILLLRNEVASLNAEIARLSERLGEIEKNLDTSGAAPAVADESPVKAEAETLSFAGQVMQRFIKMIKELKSTETGQQV
jgi:hypothetical protein